MNSPVPASPESAAPPASAWVRFLRSYGPTPTNLNLYDEHVTGALGRAKVKPITLFSSLKSLTYRLWDEQRGKLVSFRHVRKMRKEQEQAQSGAHSAGKKPVSK